MAGLDFNPREVLDHLHELGYTNITADQLREFIKDWKWDRNTSENLVPEPTNNINQTKKKNYQSDLKKLIKYDQRAKNGRRKAEGKQEECLEDSDDDDDDVDDGCGNKLKVPSSTPRRMVSPLTAEMASENMRRRKNANVRLDRDNTCNEITANCCCACNCSEVDSKEKDTKFTSKQMSQPTSSDKENVPTNRPCPAKEKVPIQPTRSRSFIRPWKYQTPGQKPPGHLSNRCDPVTLYHKYQALWQQNKIPGEENHSGLRWNIRERMLGQDPHCREKHCCPCVCRCHRNPVDKQHLNEEKSKSKKTYIVKHFKTNGDVEISVNAEVLI